LHLCFVFLSLVSQKVNVPVIQPFAGSVFFFVWRVTATIRHIRTHIHLLTAAKTTSNDSIHTSKHGTNLSCYFNVVSTVVFQWCYFLFPYSHGNLIGLNVAHNHLLLQKSIKSNHVALGLQSTWTEKTCSKMHTNTERKFTSVRKTNARTRDATHFLSASQRSQSVRNTPFLFPTWGKRRGIHIFLLYNWRVLWRSKSKHKLKISIWITLFVYNFDKREHENENNFKQILFY